MGANNNCENNIMLRPCMTVNLKGTQTLREKALYTPQIHYPDAVLLAYYSFFIY